MAASDAHTPIADYALLCDHHATGPTPGRRPSSASSPGSTRGAHYGRARLPSALPLRL